MKRTNLLTFLEDTMLFMIFYSITLVFLYVNSITVGDGTTQCIYKGFILYFFMLATELFRKKMNNFFIFSIGHLLLIVVGFLLGATMLEKVIYMLFAVALTIASFKTYIAEIKHSYSISLFVTAQSTFFLVYLFNLYMGYTAIQPFLNGFSLGFTLLFMLYVHIKNVDSSLEIITKNSMQPVSQIKSFNNKIIAIYLFISAAFLIVCPYFHLQDLVNLFGEGLYAFIRFLVSFLPQTQTPQDVPQQTQQSTQSAESMLKNLLPGKENPIVAFIEEIFIYVVNIGVVIAIIAIICYGLYLLYKTFYANSSSTNETKEFISPIVKVDKANRNLNPFRRFIDSLNVSTNDKVRKIYYKKIKKLMTLGLKISNETASEISSLASISINKDISELTTFYEKARYSNIEVSKEELNKLKDLEKNNR